MSSKSLGSNKRRLSKTWVKQEILEELLIESEEHSIEACEPEPVSRDSAADVEPDAAKA